MNRLIRISLLGLLALVLLVLGTATWLINDEEFIRGQIESRVSESLGRDLTIAALALDAGMRTDIRLQGVRLDNSAWGQASELLRVDGLSVVIDLSQLFERGIVIEDLVISGAQLNLEENDEGQDNWPSRPDPGAGDQDRSDTLVPWEHIELSHFVLTHQAPDRAIPLQFVVEQLAADHSPTGRVDLRGKGMIGGYPLSVEGFIEPLHALLAGGAVSHRLDIELGENRLHSEGTAQDALSGAGVNIQVGFSGPDFGWLLEQAALPEFSSGAFDASLRLEAADDQSLALDLDGDLGSFQAAASGKLDRLLQPTQLNLRFDVSGPDSQALGETLGVEALPAVPYRLSGNATYQARAVEIEAFSADIGPDHLSVTGYVGPWPGMTATALDIEARGPDISAWGPALSLDNLGTKAFELTGRLEEQSGRLISKKARLTLGSNVLELDGSLGRPPEFVGADLTVEVQAADISLIPWLTQFDRVPAIPGDFAATVKRGADGIHLENLNLKSQGNHLALKGFLALPAGENQGGSGNWRSRLSGSWLKGRLDLPSGRRFLELFGSDDLPDVAMALMLDLQFDQGALKFELADGGLRDIDVSLSGSIPRLPELAGASTAFSIELPSLELLETVFADLDVPDLPIRATGSVHKTQEGYDIRDLNAESGEMQLELDGLVVIVPEPMLRNASFAVSGPDFRQIYDHDFLKGLPGKFSFEGELVSNGDTEQVKSLTVRLGDSEVTAVGDIHDVSGQPSAELQVHLTVPDILEFRPYFERFSDRYPPSQAVDVSFSLAAGAEAITLTDIVAKLGESDLEGKFGFRPGEVPEYQGDLKSEHLDFSWLREPEEALEREISAQKALTGEPGAAPTAGNFVFDEEPLPVLSINPVRVDVAMQATTIKLPLTVLSDVHVGLVFSEEQLKLEPLVFTGVEGGRTSGVVLVKLADDQLQVDVSGTAKDLRLGLAAAKNQDLSTYPPWDVFVDIEATGGSEHELATSANGKLWVIAGQGRVLNSRLDLLFSDLLSELFSALNPFVQKSEFTEIDCGVARISISDGVAQADPLILQTREITATSSGKIDLATEKINLTFNTRPRKGIGISPSMVINPFIKLGGTLASPAMTLDATGMAVSGGAAVATAGLSLLGKSLYDRFLTEKDPCGKVAAELRKMYEDDNADS